MIVKSLGLLLLAYLAGSINFSIILFRLLRHEDPRRHFSGNPGTTNVYRQAGWIWALVVLSLDVGRAIGVALAAMNWAQPQLISWVGLALILGNRFPCFHDFKGGKGVANYLGFTLVITPLFAGISAIAWVLVYGLVRKPFVASLAMIIILAAGTIRVLEAQALTIIGIITTALLIFANHQANLKAFFPPSSKS